MWASVDHSMSLSTHVFHIQTTQDCVWAIYLPNDAILQVVEFAAV